MDKLRLSSHCPVSTVFVANTDALLIYYHAVYIGLPEDIQVCNENYCAQNGFLNISTFFCF